jgi:hypothetical protein
MSPPIKMPKPTLELADILRHHIAEYRNAYPLAPDQHRIVSHLLHCRTPTLGGHIERCTHCGAQRILYYSCRNRHCPKCQHIPRQRWLEKRQSELLPTPYFHIVFTLPHDLNLITSKNKSVVLNILLKAVSETLIKFGRKELGGTLGFIAVLHTWDQLQRPPEQCPQADHHQRSGVYPPLSPAHLIPGFRQNPPLWLPG